MDDVPTCRICHCTESPGSGLIKLISPCQCSGSLKYVHHSCLQQWLDATNNQRCELCKHPFSMTVKYKPIHKWSSLNASPTERRRLICNSVFNLVSMICIFWSIYVLIEKVSLDAKVGLIDWNFYVKISVVTIGLIIGVIFLFVQLKLYFSIFMRWRQSNRIVVIRNANLASHALPPPTVSSGTTAFNNPPNVAIPTASQPTAPLPLPDVTLPMPTEPSPKTTSASTNTSNSVAGTGGNQSNNLVEFKLEDINSHTSTAVDTDHPKATSVTIHEVTTSIDINKSAAGNNSQDDNQSTAINLTVY